MDILEILGKIGFDWRVFLFNLANFVIIALLLRKFFFKKIVGTIEERQRIIREGIENADAAKAELAMAEQKGEQIITDAKHEANSIVKEATAKATDVAEELRVQAEKDAAALKEKSQQQLQSERKQLMSDFRQNASDLVVLAAQKLLRSKDVIADKKAAEQVINSIDFNTK